MKTTTFEQEGKLFAVLEGRLDTAAAPETEKAMAPLYNREGKDIILDCTDLAYISSSGLRIFLGILNNAEEKGQHVYIKGMTDDVRAVFTMTGFINLFNII